MTAYQKMLSAAAFVALLTPAIAKAETTVSRTTVTRQSTPMTETTVTTDPATNVTTMHEETTSPVSTTTITRSHTTSGPWPVTGVDLTYFDINKDGIVSRAEIGSQLFAFFDTDQDGYIEPNEYEAQRVMHVQPTARTVVFRDTDGDGLADEKVVMERLIGRPGFTGLRNNPYSFSAKDMLAMNFRDVDMNNNNHINLDEWSQAYMQAYSEADTENDMYDYNE